MLYCVFSKSTNSINLESPKCLSRGRQTWLKRCSWLVRQAYNKHVTMKVIIMQKLETET